MDFVRGVDVVVRVLGCDPGSSGTMRTCYDEPATVVADMGHRETCHRRRPVGPGCSVAGTARMAERGVVVTAVVDNGHMALNDTTTSTEAMDERPVGALVERCDSTERSRCDEPVIEVAPIVDPAPAATAEDFLTSARILSELAAAGSLDVPVFRSPPRSPELDRSISRRRRGAVVSVRRRGRPVEAVRADLIEGVVVANHLDPIEASMFRRGAWSALALIHQDAVDGPIAVDRSEDGTEVVESFAPVVDLIEHASAA